MSHKVRNAKGQFVRGHAKPRHKKRTAKRRTGTHRRRTTKRRMRRAAHTKHATVTVRVVHVRGR